MISFNIFLSQLASLFVDPCSLVPDPVTSVVKEVRSGVSGAGDAGTEVEVLERAFTALGWERGLNGVHLETPCLVQNLTIGANCDTWEQNGLKRKHLVTTTLQLCRKK